MPIDLERARWHIGQAEAAIAQADRQLRLLDADLTPRARLAAATAHATLSMAITNVLLTEPIADYEPLLNRWTND